MKRKLTVFVTMMILVVSIVAANSFAYSTTSEERLGSVKNDSGVDKTAWGILYNNGGVAELQIRNSAGTYTYASGTYPANPQNPNYTTCSCPAGATRSFYAVKKSGSQIWGSASFGLS